MSEIRRLKHSNKFLKFNGMMIGSISPTPPVSSDISYGRIYNYYAIDDSTNNDGFIEGYTVPTVTELQDLRAYISTNYGSSHRLHLCAKNQEQNLLFPEFSSNEHPRWDYNTTIHNADTVGLSFLPASNRNNLGVFSKTIGAEGFMWSSTSVSETNANYFGMSNNSNIGNISKNWGFSIRLLRNLTTAEINANYTDGAVLGTVSDADGNNYTVVKISDKAWLKSNLLTTKYSNGVSISKVTDDTSWANQTSGAWCDYENDERWTFNPSIIDLDFKPNYGRLYNVFAFSGGNPLVIDNEDRSYRVPINTEYSALFSYISSEGGNGRWLKSTRQQPLKQSRWNYDAVAGGLNNYGFNALPSGRRNANGAYINLGLYNNTWTSTPSSGRQVFIYMGYNQSNFTIDNNGYVEMGHALRLMCDLKGTESSLSDGTIITTVNDADNNTYNVIKIGSNGWIDSNLKTTKYANGDNIPNPISNQDWNDAGIAQIAAQSAFDQENVGLYFV